MSVTVGDRFGRLTVVGYSGPSSVICKCDCGKTTIVRKYHLTGKSKTRSCGCLRKESSANTGRVTIVRNSKVAHDINAMFGTNFQKIEKKEPQKDNTSGFTGVSYRPNIGKYEAYITLHGHKRHLGLFDSPELAAEARESAREELFAPIIEEKNRIFG